MAKDLTKVINEDETIMWKGRPNKKCFILESIFNPMLLFSLMWLSFDMVFIFAIASGDPSFGAQKLFLLFFFLIHLMPVWLYIFGVIFSILKYKNTAYVITDAGVYISGGVFSYFFDFKPFTKLSNITMHRGVFDQFIKVGDVVFSIEQQNDNNKGKSFAIINIPDYEDVYKLVKKLQRDVYSDTQYPNDLRPSANHGYRTKIEYEEDYSEVKL
ncbi:MAG: PH domain-containing protein [Bacilli bacterium]|nr:PH domain-containing protein [Bacilli bacterium]